jgi:hypothetical protein
MAGTLPAWRYQQAVHLIQVVAALPVKDSIADIWHSDV